MPKIYLEHYRIFNLGLTSGVITQKEVVAWADGVLLKEDATDSFVVELSLMGSKDKNAVITLLNGFIGQEIAPIAGRVLLGLLYRRFVDGVLSLETTVRAIDRLILTAGLTKEEQRFMLPFDDGYSLAKSQTFGTEEAIELATLRFLEVYKDFSLENMHEWDEIDTRTLDNIRQLK